MLLLLTARRRFFDFGSPVWRIAAALVLVAAIGAWLLSQWPQPVSAQEIVRRAQASLNSPLAAGLQSYFIAEQTTLWASTEAGSGANAAPPVRSRSKTKRWFGAPDKWRLESVGEVYAADERPAAAACSAAGDGRSGAGDCSRSPAGGHAGGAPAIPVLLPGTAAGEAWGRRGFTNVDGTGTDSSVMVLRDGVLIAMNSFTFSPEQLLDIAATLQTVPGSKAPLPTPQPPTPAQVRSVAPFPIYVPTWIPDGLAPEPPVGYEITYHDGSGQPVLTVTMAPGSPTTRGQPVSR